MQTEASVLPVVQLDEHRPFNRKSKLNSKSSILESKNQSLCRNTLLPSNKKSLNPLPGTPYRGSIKQQSLSDESKSNKSVLGQRVMSAKMLHFKQLQNQLADAHYHLNELANENRLLKALQKRQDSALRRYEGTNAELPRLINSHHEELRVLQTKYKKLKDLHKDTCNLLKEKENELYSVNSQNKHLLQLSKDRHLEEREKLQLQLSDMNHKMQQQHETIQLLHRKLALETKSLKHQLHVEISKHKETQKNLQESIEKLKNLECLLDNREKRQYYNGQVPIYTKQKNLGSHSLTNLSIANSTKVSSRNKRSENDIPRDNLPSLDTLESNNDGKVIQATDVNHDRSTNQLKSETMASLQQIRKFRLQRSSNMRKNAYSMDDIRFRPKDTETRTHNNEELTLDSAVMLERDDLNDKNESGKLRKLFSRIKNQNQLKVEFDYSSDDGKSDISEHHIESYPSTAHKSRELYAKLISSDDTSESLDNTMKRTDIHYANEEEEEELNMDLMKDLAFRKHLQESKLKVLQHYRNKDIYNSDSDIDSEEKIDINGDSTEYKMNEFQINSSKYAKEQFSKSFNDTNQQEYSASEIREQISKEIAGRLQNAELQRISDDTLDDIHAKNAEVIEQSSKAKKIWLEDRQLLKNNEIDHFSTDIKKEDHSKEEETKYSEDKTVYSDSSHGNHETLKQNNVYDEIKSSPSPKGKDIEKSSQQTYEKEPITDDSDGNNQSTHNLEKEYLKSRIEETLSTMQHDDKEILNKDNFNVETKNKLNTSFEAEDVSTLSNNAHVSHQNEQSKGTKSEITNTKQSNEKKKVINYNKEKLLATMRAIDDNENIEFLNQGFRNHNINRVQITENLYRGLPTHSKPKRDIIKDIFEDNHIENKVRGTCSKSH